MWSRDHGAFNFSVFLCEIAKDLSAAEPQLRTVCVRIEEGSRVHCLTVITHQHGDWAVSRKDSVDQVLGTRDVNV